MDGEHMLSRKECFVRSGDVSDEGRRFFSDRAPALTRVFLKYHDEELCAL